MQKKEEKPSSNEGIIEKTLEGYDIVEFYKVTENAYVLIHRVGNKLVYMPIEPVLINNEAKLLVELKELVPRVFTFDPYLLRYAPERLEKSLKEALDKVLKTLKIKISKTTYNKLFYYLRRDLIGYGPIEIIYNDPRVEDITCTGTGSPVYVFHRDYEWLPTTIKFMDPITLTNFARRLAYRSGQDLVYANPIVEGPLPPKDYRAHLTLDIVSRRGTSFTIRRSGEEPFTITKLIKLGTLSVEMAAYLWLMVSHTMTILIGGPMASGKTTLLNAIAMLIPPQKKIVTIEETSEIRLPHENWTPLIVRPSTEEGVKDITLFDLLKSSLRQRPDYIIVGEIRGEEAYTFFQAIAVGHGGLGTIHGESFDQVIRRLENPPLNIPRSMIPLLNTLVVLQRIRTDRGIARKVIEITDILGYEPSRDIINAASSFKYDYSAKKWIQQPTPAGLRLVAAKTGMTLEEVMEDYRRRQVIVKWLLKEGVLHHLELSRVMEEFYYSPDTVYDKARAAGVHVGEAGHT